MIKLKNQPVKDPRIHIDHGAVHVVRKGNGPVPVLVLPGSGVLFPDLEYASFAEALAEKGPYSVWILSKLGYGISDMTEENRDLDTLVEESRSVLAALGHTGPIVLAAHSVSFLDAMHWANRYPDEVSALVGLDPATPDAYEGQDLVASYQQLERFHKPEWKRRVIFALFSRALLNRYPASIRKQIKRVARRNFASTVWVNEGHALPDNLKQIIQEGPPTTVPTLFLISDGRDTFLSGNEWRSRALGYLERFETTEFQLIDLPHDLYRRIPQETAEAVNAFLQKHLSQAEPSESPELPDAADPASGAPEDPPLKQGEESECSTD